MPNTWHLEHAAPRAAGLDARYFGAPQFADDRALMRAPREAVICVPMRTDRLIDVWVGKTRLRIVVQHHHFSRRRHTTIRRISQCSKSLTPPATPVRPSRS